MCLGDVSQKLIEKEDENPIEVGDEHSDNEEDVGLTIKNEIDKYFDWSYEEGLEGDIFENLLKCGEQVQDSPVQAQCQQ